MLSEKLYKRIYKFIRRMEYRLFGPSRKEMLSLSRSNRAFKKEQIEKKNRALKRLLAECSTIKPKSTPKPLKRNSKDYDDRRIESTTSSDRDDSGEQAYQTGHLF